MHRLSIVAVFGIVAALCLGVFALPSCAGTECNFSSQCGPGMYCLEGRCGQDCQRDVDCASGLVCSAIGRCELPSGDSGVDAVITDGGSDAVVTDGPVFDMSFPDAFVDSSVDGTVDAPIMGAGIYLDRCTTAADCMSGRCFPDVGGSNFCTRPCTTHSQCAAEHLCNGSVCVRDDTGEACSVAAPATCSLGACIGAMGGTGACTHECNNASDCPSGFSCSPVGANKVCMEIEKPCAGPTDCVSQSCLSVQGCTAGCVTAADCPARFGGLPPYECRVAFGSAGPICVPPADIAGNDRTGALCRFSGMINLCRSGACNDLDVQGPTCVQTCTADGGCGPGLGCFPEDDMGSIVFICKSSGSGALGAFCGSARECDSGLCDLGNYCTRLCFDGLCPTGMTCQTTAGVSICRRP